VRREHEPLRAQPQPGLEQLRRQLHAAERRRDALTLAAVLFALGLMWLGLAGGPAWPGWALFGLGIARLAWSAGR
jgi:uncharacterized membrane protein